MKPQPTNEVAKLRAIPRWTWKTLAVAAAALLIGCATPRDANKQHALVCPQCQTVEVRNARAGDPFGYSSRRWGGGGGPRKIYEHRCEGCQGVMTTFFRERKFQHKCSICKDTPFSCPVVHPITERL